LEVLPSSLLLIWYGLHSDAPSPAARCRAAMVPVAKQFLVFLIPIGLILILTLINGTQYEFLQTAFLRRIHSHLLVKNYDFARRYCIPIFQQTGILWIGLAGFMADALAGRLCHFSVVPDYGFRDSRWRPYLFLWALCASISVWVGGYFFPHYFLEIVPILIIASAAFFLRIPSWFFYSLVPASLLISKLLKSDVNFGRQIAFIALPCLMAIWAERRAPAMKGIWRIAMVFAVLMLTLNSNPISSAIAVYRSGNPHYFYTSNDRDALDTAHYLKTRQVRSLFVYDYTPEIYYLSGIVPQFRYGYKAQYVNFSALIKDVKNYPGDESLLGGRSRDLLERLGRGDFQYVVVNYNTMLRNETADAQRLLSPLTHFAVEKVFGGVWVYRWAPEKKARQDNGRYIVLAASVDQSSDQINVRIKRPAIYAESDVDLNCIDRRWHCPEDGVVYPMLCKQDPAQIEIIANRRGIDGGRCSISLRNLSGSHRIDDFPLKRIDPQSAIRTR